MNILLLASHAVAEYDDVRMFTDLGYDVFAPGGYEVPGSEGEGIRPPLPEAPYHPELVARLQEVRAERGEPGPAIDWGKAALHDDIIDWADVIICHHFPEQWIAAQWGRIKHKRVVWRTCGQSNRALERVMGDLEGLEIVRYSPAERRHFGEDFAGQSALIRFGKYPDDYGPWVGDEITVGNVTQDMIARGESVGYPYWLAATEGLPNRPVGKGQIVFGKPSGPLPYEMMLDYLRHIRVYLYTGTRPASYTLGLIEAMLSGVPVVSIGPKAWGAGWGGEDLFEGHEILRHDASGHWYDYPADARARLAGIISGDYIGIEAWSMDIRQRAIDLFGIETVGAQWREFLG